MRTRRRSGGAGSGWSGVGGSGSEATGSAARGRARGGRSGDGRGRLMATSEANDPLVTRECFGDVEAHLEFMVPKGSNSGVKFEGVYEIQIFDSYGAKDVKASYSGGVYPRAELLPRYHHIDEGYPPRVNASRPPGEWQTLDVVFRAPRFD